MKYFVLSIFCLLILSCGGGGGGIAGGNSAQTTQVVLNIPIASCEKINECEAYGEELCVNDFYLLDNIDTEIGLASGDYENFNAVRIVINDRVIVEDASSSLACVDEIKELECSNPLVAAAYDPALDNPLQNLAAMLPASCAEIF